MSRRVMPLVGVVGSVLFFLLSVAAMAAGNGSTPRVISGEYRNETIAEGARRGGERFELAVHVDGSRTLSISSDLTSRNAWFTVVLRGTADFRPLEAYADYWNGSVHKGSALFRVEGERVMAESRGKTSGVQRSETVVPMRFSIGSHPVSADGWHTANHDPARPGKQAVALYSVEAGADPAKPVLGTLVSLDIEYIGDETIDVPAGRFETRRYRLAGMNDLWVYGPDRIVIKSELPARGLRYVLTALQTR